MKKLKTQILTIGLAAAACRGRCELPVANNPGHWYAGASNANSAQLFEWTNGGNFTATSGYVYWLTYTNSAQTGYYMTNGMTNYYYGSQPTFTALGNGTEPANDAGANPAIAAANGAFLATQIVSLAGPAGGHYYFWDLNVSNSSHPAYTAAPTFTIAVGDTPANDVFILSDPSSGAGAPGADPFGHMHGRRYAVDQPGTYTLGLQVIDLSTNGPGGGPLQTPSQVYYATYQAGQTIDSISVCNNVVSVTFPSTATAVNSHGSTTNAVYTLLETTNPAVGWTPIGSNVLAYIPAISNTLASNSVFGTNAVGTSYMKTFTYTNAATAEEFYKLSVTPAGGY